MILQKIVILMMKAKLLPRLFHQSFHQVRNCPLCIHRPLWVNLYLPRNLGFLFPRNQQKLAHVISKQVPLPQLLHQKTKIRASLKQEYLDYWRKRALSQTCSKCGRRIIDTTLLNYVSKLYKLFVILIVHILSFFMHKMNKFVGWNLIDLSLSQFKSLSMTYISQCVVK